MKWPFLQKLLDDNVFTYLDLYFAKTLLGEEGSEEAAAILCYLMASSRQGHLCVQINENEILPSTNIKGLAEKIRKGFRQLSFKEEIICLKDTIYLQKNYHFESQVLQGLQRNTLDALFDETIFSDKLESLTELLPLQKEALRKALKHSISFICGGPGTGKTYTASFLIQLFSQVLKPNCTLQVAITAPTGKAVAQLQEKIKGYPVTAKTLHSLLGIYKKKPSYLPLPYDLIIVDEASMLDVKLMANLLLLKKDGARLVFLGDPSQLPPIDSGSVFADIVKCCSENATFLEIALRFKNDNLFAFSKALQEVNEKLFLEILQKNSSVKQSSLSLVDLLNNPFPLPKKERIDPVEALKELNQFRILSCLRVGPYGVDALNAAILRHKIKNANFGSWIAVPLIITVNDNVKELYNGMSGVAVCRISSHEIGLSQDDQAYFFQEDKVISYPCLQLPKFEWAYCLSVHKSQGSEYNNVLLVVPPGSEVFGREILYTAATRAKEKLEIMGAIDTIIETARKGSLRVSGIANRMR